MQLEDLQHIQNYPLFLAIADTVFWQATDRDKSFEPDQLLFLEYQLEQQMLYAGKYGYPIYNTDELNIPYLESVKAQPCFPKRRSMGEMTELGFRVLMKDIDAAVVIHPIFMGYPDFALTVSMLLKKTSPQGVDYEVELTAYSCYDDNCNKNDEADQLAETMHKSLNSNSWRYNPESVQEFEAWIADSHQFAEGGLDEKPYQLTPFKEWRRLRTAS